MRHTDLASNRGNGPNGEPSPRAFISGNTASVGYNTPQNITAIALSKSATVVFSRGATEISPRIIDENINFAKPRSNRLNAFVNAGWIADVAYRRKYFCSVHRDRMRSRLELLLAPSANGDSAPYASQFTGECKAKASGASGIHQDRLAAK